MPQSDSGALRILSKEASPPPSLPQLPNEIVYQVYEFAVRTPGSPLLSNLCRISEAWRGWAQSRLFQEYDDDHMDEDNSIKFIRAVTESGLIGSYVRDVCFGDDWRVSCVSWHSIELFMSVIQRLIHGLRPTCDEEILSTLVRLLRGDFKETFSSAFVPFLKAEFLAHCTSIESLNVSASDFEDLICGMEVGSTAWTEKDASLWDAIELCVSVLEEQDLSDEKKSSTLYGLLNGNMERSKRLLLAYYVDMKNLQTLDSTFQDSDVAVAIELKYKNKNKNNNNPNFTGKLSRLVVRNWSITQDIISKDFWRLLSLPALRNLEIYGFQFDGNNLNPDPGSEILLKELRCHPVHQPLKLESMKWFHADIRATGTAHLLSLCPVLKSFQVEWIWGENNEHEQKVNWNGIGNAIRQYCPKLEELSWIPEDCELILEKGDISQNSIGDLRSLEKLKKLHMPRLMLSESPDAVPDLTSILPFSLEVFTIHDCSKDSKRLEESLKELARSARFTALSTICIVKPGKAHGNPGWLETFEHNQIPHIQKVIKGGRSGVAFVETTVLASSQSMEN